MKKEKYVMSTNLAGWGWKITKEPWEERLARACECIKKAAPEAFLIGLQEVIPGVNEKYIDLIKSDLPNYVVVLPYAYNNNYRSAINVLLINRDGYHNHCVRTLPHMYDSLLYNYVSIATDYGYYEVLNAHTPHISNENRPLWYQKKREAERAVFEQSIFETCKLYKYKTDIQFIFMADANTTPESSFIQQLSGTVEPLLYNATKASDLKIATWNNPEYKSSHIDYIFYSMGSMKSSAIDVYNNDIIDTPIAEKISDHAIIRGRIRTNITDWCG